MGWMSLISAAGDDDDGDDADGMVSCVCLSPSPLRCVVALLLHGMACLYPNGVTPDSAL